MTSPKSPRLIKMSVCYRWFWPHFLLEEISYHGRFLISVPSSPLFKNSGEILKFNFKIKIQLKQKIKLVSCNSSPLVAHRQRRTWAAEQWEAALACEKNTQLTCLPNPSLLNAEEEKDSVHHCRRTGHSGSHSITIVDLDQSVYILEASCWEHTHLKLFQTSTMSRRNDVSATLKPISKDT